ncbi:MAG: sigma-70 family RNA polymerase sigma factor [Acidimicrobiia bacterium]
MAEQPFRPTPSGVGNGQQSHCPQHHPGGGPYGPRSDALEELHRDYAAGGDPSVRDQLAAAYDEFALGLARKLHTRRDSTEDLAQVARVGLLQAIDRFDPDLERPFVAFAQATILGELKRHLRDRTWVMRVPRSLQEHYLEVVRAADDLAQELGRSPTVTEVADRTGLSEEHVLEAMELGAVQRPTSLDAPLLDGRTSDPGVEDAGLAAVEGRTFFASLLSRVPEQERRILELRFVDGLTQTQIGLRLDVSQMYVSRVLTRTLDRLRVLARAG